MYVIGEAPSAWACRPVPETIARCDALAREAAGQRAAEFSLLGCRAALLAMTEGYAEARGSMARARTALAELHLREMAAYLAHLDAFAETLAGDPAAAERAALDAEAIVSESGDRWFLSTVYVDLAHAILAQGRHADAAEAVERIETVPSPCDSQWVIKRHTARALVASQRGDQELGLQEARAAVAAAEGTSLVVFCANAYRALAEVLLAAGRAEDASTAAARALALDQAKGNTVAAAATQRRFASLQGFGPWQAFGWTTAWSGVAELEHDGAKDHGGAGVGGEHAQAGPRSDRHLVVPRSWPRRR